MKKGEKMRRLLSLALLALLANADCLTCHKGIEHIKDPNSPMMQQIAAMSKAMGDNNNCVFCHGGNPKATTKEKAHVAPKNHPGGLKVFVKDPGGYYVMENTCGVCHMDTVKNLKKSLMSSEAGKIQGNLYAFGAQKTRKALYGNFDVKDEDGKTPAWGSCSYKKYMQHLVEKYPDNFVDELKQLPQPAKSIDDLKNKSKEEIIKYAAIAYTRSDCLRCHVGVQGRKGRGDYRGMGCSACHIPYSNEGYYEGNDPTIDKTKAGKLLVHTMQGSRKSKVYIPSTKKTYSGIDVETCNSCHNRGKRIGVSYVGLMESAYMSPFQEGGKPQPKLHGKRYIHVASDVHYKAGMTCQDCHTSIDMHGDGNIQGTTLAQVEIECQDCHGTPEKYPWELPLGEGEKAFSNQSKPRGVSKKLPNWMKFGTIYNPEDGYILTARGNPYGNVIKRGNEVIVHLANGKDLKVPVLKNLKPHFNAKARVAMVDIPAHTQKMECYACHATWAPQCYGCHVKVDMREQKTDWLASAKLYKNGATWESFNKYKKLQGKAKETRSYLRWEDPILGINGEGMISPIIPGCQVTYTIIGPNGETITLNKQTIVEDNGKLVKATDIAPAQPHTIQKEARDCVSCHANPKTLGYGTNDGMFLTTQNQNLIFDIKNSATGEIVTKNATIQIAAIPGMNYDWTKIVSRDGKRLQLVGSHWPLSRPLDKDIRDKMEKTGTCLGCHSQMRVKSLWEKVNKNPGILTDKDHQEVMKKALKALAKESN